MAFDFGGFNPWFLAWVPFFEPVGGSAPWWKYGIMENVYLVVAEKLREKRARGSNMPFKDVLWVA